MRPRVRRHLLAAAAATGGLVLFAYAIRNVGWPDVAAGIRRVGWGMAPILALSGLRFVLRAECWRRCMAPDARILSHRRWSLTSPATPSATSRRSG